MNILKKIFVKSSSERYISYLKSKGVNIGKNFIIKGRLKSIGIDLTRPSLITIGENVTINSNFLLFTHDFVSGVFVHKYHDFLPSSGIVRIGNNVRFGVNCTVLKGVTIGDNCFIAAGSLVTRDIPDNCIAGGVPAKVLCDLDIYYQKRKEACISEAKVYAQSIIERYKRDPTPDDFWEEFPLFIDKSNISDYPNFPIKKQLGDSFDFWLQNHVAPFHGFQEFLKFIKNR